MIVAAVAEHPVAGTLTRLAEPLPSWPVHLGPPEEAGWRRYPGLLADAALGTLLDDLDRHLHGGRALAAQTLVGRVAGPVSTVLAAAVFTERRLPVVGPGGLALGRLVAEHELLPPAVALTDATMLVLPDDAAAGHPDVTVVPDLTALQLELTTGLHRLFEPLVAAVSRVGRRGRRALWQSIADRVVVGYLLAGKHAAEVDRARHEADRTLALAAKPMNLTVDWLELEHHGRPELFTRKSVCCLYYKSVEYRDQYCSTCPLLPREESIHRLRIHLDACGEKT